MPIHTTKNKCSGNKMLNKSPYIILNKWPQLVVNKFWVSSDTHWVLVTTGLLLSIDYGIELCCYSSLFFVLNTGNHCTAQSTLRLKALGQMDTVSSILKLYWATQHLWEAQTMCQEVKKPQTRQTPPVNWIEVPLEPCHGHLWDLDVSATDPSLSCNIFWWRMNHIFCLKYRGSCN